MFLKSRLKFKWEGKEAPNKGKKCLWELLLLTVFDLVLFLKFETVTLYFGQAPF